MRCEAVRGDLDPRLSQLESITTLHCVHFSAHSFCINFVKQFCIEILRFSPQPNICILTSVFCMPVLHCSFMLMLVYRKVTLQKPITYRRNEPLLFHCDWTPSNKLNNSLTRHTYYRPAIIESKCETLYTHAVHDASTVPLQFHGRNCPIFRNIKQKSFSFSFRRTSSVTLNQLPKHIHYTT